MDKERIVISSPNWNTLKEIFHDMGLTISDKKHVNNAIGYKNDSSPRKNSLFEIISHGILVIVNEEALFLQMTYTYEYKCILSGIYTGAKLYHYISLITKEERNMLYLDPVIQWHLVHPNTQIPKEVHKKMLILQKHIDKLLFLIPMGKNILIRNDSKSSTYASTDDIDEIYSRYTLDIPKGRAKDTESSVDAALRELYEETGIQLSSDHISASYVDRIVGTDGNLYTTYIHAAFLPKRPKVQLSHEFKGSLWLSLDDNILLKRHRRILQTFLHNINESK